MGKLDDMRRLREQQFDDAKKPKGKASAADVAVKPKVSTANGASNGKPEVEEKSAPKAAPAAKASKKASPKAAAAEGTEGKCPVCGKMKPLKGGVMASHQKGFGKACAGSRKEPV